VTIEETFDEDAAGPTQYEANEHSGQVRMAYRLCDKYTGALLHVHGIGWHYYDGKRWARDHGESVTRRAVLSILREALAESLQDKQLRRDVKSCESGNGIKGVLSVAQALTEFAVTVNDMDADPYLLNCANGTLDLRTRELRPHTPKDRITRVATGAYDPTADQTTWATFLERVLPDEPERAYLQRVFGLAASGNVKEHLFPVLIGTGANGKGTTYGAVGHALGDYYTPINPDLLMVKDRGGIGGPEMMQLLGARLVIGSETEQGSKLNEALMKRLTGGDRLTARHLYKSPVSWEPTHQLVYITNHEPKVSGNDPAVWRRLRVIPFSVVLPESEWDKDLSDRLKLSADAILGWVVAGYFDYVDSGGMREPETVRRATDAYQQRSDPVARFVADDEYVIRQEDVRASTRELYGAWQKFAQEDGAEPMNEKAFSGELKRLGFERRTLHGRKVWDGLGVISDGF